MPNTPQHNREELVERLRADLENRLLSPENLDRLEREKGDYFGHSAEGFKAILEAALDPLDIEKESR